VTADSASPVADLIHPLAADPCRLGDVHDTLPGECGPDRGAPLAVGVCGCLVGEPLGLGRRIHVVQRPARVVHKVRLQRQIDVLGVVVGQVTVGCTELLGVDGDRLGSGCGVEIVLGGQWLST
jgi:hypothetical protein